MMQKIVSHSKRQGMNIEKRERKAKNERKSNNSNTIFFIFFYTFLYRKICFVRKHIWKNLVYIVTIVLQFYRVGNAIIKQQCPYTYALVLHTPYLTKNNWQKTTYFNVDFNSNGLFLLYLSIYPSTYQYICISIYIYISGKYF